MNEVKWMKRWKNWVARTKLPGVWQRKEGGYVVRARAVDRTTGKMKEVKKVMPNADAATAYKWLCDELERVAQGSALPAKAHTPRFADYAVSLLERKMGEKGTLKSAKTQDRWRHTLTHLIGGVGNVRGLGDYYLDEMKPRHLAQWRNDLAPLIEDKTYSPVTVNGWISILRVIFKSATWELQLSKNPIEGLDNFDTSTVTTYTDEEPNSLTPEEARAFLECLRELYPQHYAMTHLGLATGLRPSSLRPLRRRGPTPDVIWDQCQILIRRSHTRRTEVMNKTKTGVKQRITLPTETMEILQWHVATQLVTPEQEASDLLFPSITGGYRAPCVLNKPFADVALQINLGKSFSQRGLRRSFNDLARFAQVTDLVKKSISGHLTDSMVERYSTVCGKEQQKGIQTMLTLMANHGAETDSAKSGALSGAPGKESGALGQSL